jgi:hypothetical protein
MFIVNNRKKIHQKSHRISRMTNNFNFKHSISKIKNMNINKLDIDIKRIFQKNIVIKVEKDNKIN